MNPIILALSLTLIVFIILFIREKIQNTSLLQSKKLLTKALTDLESLQSKFQEQIQINSSLATKLTLKEEALSQKDKDLLTIKEEHQKNYHALQIHFQENLSQLQMYHKENLKIQQQEYQNIEKNMQEQMQNYFKQQNENLFHQNKLAFNTDSKKLLEEIFTPIKHKIEEYSKNLIHNEATLKTNIENIFKYSQNIGEKADNLATILKGDKKIRGNFGELQLRNVLEQSGLREGEQYHLQQHFQEEGQKFIPDAVIYLSKERSVVVDSKFSLPDVIQQERTDILSSEIAKNLKDRIDELSKKPYTSIIDAYDFVLLFIPYQNILDIALEFDNNLYQYAYQKKVYLTTPNTLFIALKTIEITWIKIQSDENISKAFKEIAKFYEKFVGVLEDFEKIKRSMTTLQNATDEMNKKLLSGNGNLANKFETLKLLGIKTQKSITSSYKKESLEE